HQAVQDPLPGIKDEQGQWETRPHRHRIITVTEDVLEVFAKVLEEEDTPVYRTRLPQAHSLEILNVLRRFAKTPERLSLLGDAFFATQMLNEVTSQQDGSIMRQAVPAFKPVSPA